MKIVFLACLICLACSRISKSISSKIPIGLYELFPVEFSVDDGAICNASQTDSILHYFFSNSHQSGFLFLIV